jgi:hypothetical protein
MTHTRSRNHKRRKKWAGLVRGDKDRRTVTRRTLETLGKRYGPDIMRDSHESQNCDAVLDGPVSSV